MRSDAIGWIGRITFESTKSAPNPTLAPTTAPTGPDAAAAAPPTTAVLAALTAVVTNGVASLLASALAAAPTATLPAPPASALAAAPAAALPAAPTMAFPATVPVPTSTADDTPPVDRSCAAGISWAVAQANLQSTWVWRDRDWRRPHDGMGMGLFGDGDGIVWGWGWDCLGMGMGLFGYRVDQDRSVVGGWAVNSPSHPTPPSSPSPHPPNLNRPTVPHSTAFHSHLNLPLRERLVQMCRVLPEEG